MKWCYGPQHGKDGAYLICRPNDPESAFWFFGTGRRAGKPLSRCKACMRLQRGRDPVVSGLVPTSELEPKLQWLVERLGKAETARRLGISPNAFGRSRDGLHETMRLGRAQKIDALVAEVAHAGEKRDARDIRHGTEARGKEERRRRYIAAKKFTDAEIDAAKAHKVDLTPPDNQWWVFDGRDWLPRYGSEMLGSDF